MHASRAEISLKEDTKRSALHISGRVRLAPYGSAISAKRPKVHGDQVVPEIRGREYGRQPAFVRKLRNAAVGTGCDIRLKVSVTGSPLPTLNWFRNNTPLPPDADDYGALSIRDCQSTDAGVYTCIARNAHGEARTSAVLAVLEVEEEVQSGLIRNAEETNGRTCKLHPDSGGGRDLILVCGAPPIVLLGHTLPQRNERFHSFNSRRH
ncbi:striated muscle-specific serine/threonine-protein kinase-like [Hypanus sabinus]|uniref:striated muscle-specific serine/threonine-protein kinase-like n=1 Tax=Hypanus sabinus TaxID=79690 RepID=UPI0028C3D25B|nr:striated muscle-specific serine/threonine-protein kinase-like [Hypanus sabinus]